MTTGVSLPLGWKVMAVDGGFGLTTSQTLLWIGLNWKQQPYKFNTNRLIGKLDCFK
jgi:hypothetical protein